MDWRLTDRVCLVTGASRGIGKAIALALGRQGAIVIGTATSDSGAELIGDYLRANEIQGVGLRLDVTLDDSVSAVLAAIDRQYGSPEVLVNNAGIVRDGLLMRMQEHDWDAIMDTNLKSVFRLSKACLRGMLKARCGRIISIASVVGVMGNPGQSNYAAAKAGLIGFSKSLAREVASRNITVNVIAPGFIATDMTADMDSDHKQQLMQQIPLRRLGTPEDVASSAVFLASPMADYVTGATLHVNGGMLMV